MAEYKGILNPVPKNRGGYEVNYSTTEHESGTWIDGSVLYEKTISCGALPNTSTKTISHGITGLKEVLYGEGMAIKTGAFKPIPYMWNSINSVIAFEFTDQYIYINTTADYSSYTESYVTLRYTKTS